MGNAAVDLTEEITGIRASASSGFEAPPLRCLLMDDSDFDRRVIKRVAKRSRFKTEIIETASIEETKLLLAQDPPDIVMVDYRVPDGDGIAFAHEICRSTAVPPPPVIVITGDGTDGAAIRALRAGASDFLPKAEITPDLFDGAIENAIRAQGRAAPSADPGEVAMAELAALRQMALGKMRLLKSEILPVLAHSLKAAKGTTPGDQDRTEVREDMTRRARRIPALIDDMLIAALAGSAEPIGERVDLAAVIQSILHGDDTGALARDAAVTVGALPVVWGDPSRLTMLFALLLNGAARACPINCNLEISVGSGRDPKGNHIVWVSDNGLSLAARRRMLDEEVSALGGASSDDGDPFAWSLGQRLAEQNNARFKLADGTNGGVRVMMQFAGGPRS